MNALHSSALASCRLWLSFRLIPHPTAEAPILLMLTALLIFMASRGEAPRGRSRNEGRWSRDTDTPPRKSRGRARAARPPQPNHFLSVRIENAQIWEKVSTVQGDILASNTQLADAAIPVQDLHLTLFVLTLKEQDGSLQQARETLESCHDILREHDLSTGEEPQTPRAEEECSASSIGGGRASPLTLSFRGLGTFRNKVLFAKLLEDEQAARLRSLVSALHRRFAEARLLNPPPASRTPGKSSCVATDGGDYEFEFQPHLTVMKTSKLRDRTTVIPPASYDRYNKDWAFGDHAPSALELSSMLEREDVPPLGSFEARQYYRCEHKLALPVSTRSLY